MASSRQLAAAAAAAVLAALLLASAGGASAQAQPCTLTLHLNASASTVSLEGSAVVAPIQQALIPTYPDALVGFEGALTLALPGGGPCPATAEAAAQQLAGATLQTTAGTGPLRLYPTDSIEVRPLLLIWQCSPPGSSVLLSMCSAHTLPPGHLLPPSPPPPDALLHCCSSRVALL